MRRDLFLTELRKIWTVPMLPIFLLLAVLFNSGLIVGTWYAEEDSHYVRYVSEVSEKIGGRMGEEFDQKTAALPESPYRSMLLLDTGEARDTLDTFDAEALGENIISLCHMDGWVADLFSQKYAKLQYSVKKLGASDASLSLAAGSMTEPLFDILFGRLCPAIITEGILLAVLLALFVTGNEASNRTEPVIYVTRVGRRVQKAKGAAGLISVLLSFCLLAESAIGLFAGLWRLGPIWKSNMSSQFHQIYFLEERLPFLTWRSFSVAGYLVSTLILGLLVTVVFFLCGLALGLYFRNVYRGFLAFLVLAALNLQWIFFSGNTSLWPLYELAQWTPMGLWWSKELWFTDMGLLSIIPWQECFATVWCLVVGLGLLAAVYRWFQKREIR